MTASVFGASNVPRHALLACIACVIAGCGGGGGSAGTISPPPPPTSTAGLSARPSNTTCIAGDRPVDATGSFALESAPAFPNLSFQTLSDLKQAPGDNDFWYVLELRGVIRRFANDPAVDATDLMMDIRSRVSDLGPGSDTGAVGFTFHPNYPTDPRIFITYTVAIPNRFVIHVSSFRTNDGGQTFDPNSETVLLEVEKTNVYHDGGFLAFGPDGFLYVGIGDGGGYGDDHPPIGNGQKTQTVMGKVLRIDVSGSSGTVPYRIPASNPFAGNPACNVNGTSTSNCPEIFAWGFRNPFRGSFDRSTGQLWIGDVGQERWEEADRVTLGGNYGWRCFEGTGVFNSDCGTAQNLLPPVVQFANPGGSAMIGGYVYRGQAIPLLRGKFVFADFLKGAFFVDATATPTVTKVFGGDPSLGDGKDIGVGGIVAFAEDQAGEIYIADYFGSVVKLTATGIGSGPSLPSQLSQTGCVDSSNPSSPATGLIPYAPAAPFWSDDAIKRRWIALPNNSRIDVSAASGDWDFPNGTVLMKDFSIGNQLVETRFFMRHNDGSWAGYTYEWNAAQSEATRVTGGKDVTVAGQVWHIPSEAECLSCHTQAAGRSLGLETAQLNSNFSYPSQPSPPFTGRTDNQLHTLAAVDLFAPALTQDPASLPALPDPYGSTGTLAERARAWLHTNCSQCHRPNGGAPSTMDLRYSTAMDQTNTCNADPANTLGVANARLIKPSDPDGSIVYLRMNRRGANQMPPLASNLVDTRGAQLLRDWIAGMNSTCQ
ncbi:MAG: PQQ-dependent sugar dehydrogenase [Steroidobacteraceae bacterium]